MLLTPTCNDQIKQLDKSILIRNALRKKNGIMWKKFPSAEGFFFILRHFWFSKNNHNLWYKFEKVVGIKSFEISCCPASQLLYFHSAQHEDDHDDDGNNDDYGNDDDDGDDNDDDENYDDDDDEDCNDDEDDSRVSTKKNCTTFWWGRPSLRIVKEMKRINGM